MRTFIAIIKSLVVPFFNGIFTALSGGLGGCVALCAWLQVFVQGGLAVTHTVNAGAAVALSAVFLGGQAFAALCSFLILNGLSYEPLPRLKQRYLRLELAVSILAWLVGCVSHGAGCLVVGIFSPVSSVIGLVFMGGCIATIQAFLVVAALVYQVSHRN